MKSEAVEKVEELGGSSQGTRSVGRVRLGIEMGRDRGGPRNLQGGPVDSQQTKSLPGAQGGMAFDEGKQVLVEFGERVIVKFAASLTERAFGDLSNGGERAAQSLEERIQLRLQRPFEKVDQKEN